jgi:hypothetical protein
LRLFTIHVSYLRSLELYTHVRKSSQKKFRTIYREAIYPQRSYEALAAVPTTQMGKEMPAFHAQRQHHEADELGLLVLAATEICNHKRK